MKQHITGEQIKELSNKQQQKLMSWYENSSFYPEYGDDVINVYVPKYNQCHCGLADQRLLDENDNETEKCYHLDLIPLLSIGQMIEFLSESNLYYLSNSYIDDNFKNIVSSSEYGELSIGWRNELCDDLWEAVKQVLEIDSV